jgi:putative colanic acid biosynthesis UDP-glucose lipid carrier transferase
LCKTTKTAAHPMSNTNGPLRRLESWVCALQRLVDVVIIIGAQALAHAFDFEPWREQTTSISAVALLDFGFAAERRGLYRPRRTGTILGEIKDALMVWLAVPLALFGFWFLTKTAAHYSRVASTAWFAFTPLLLCAVRVGARIVLRILRAQGRNLRRVAILGYTKDAERLAEAFEAMPWLGLKLTGIYDDRLEERRYVAEPLRRPVIGRFADLVRACHDGKLDAVYVGLPLRAEVRTAEILAALADTTVSVYLVADLVYCSLLGAQWGQVGNIPVVSLHDSPFQGIVGWGKRIEDLLLGSFILLLAIFPMLCIAVAIKIQSPGPVFFRQWCYGSCGKKIRIVKFRTATLCEDGPDIVNASLSSSSWRPASTSTSCYSTRRISPSTRTIPRRSMTDSTGGIPFSGFSSGGTRSVPGHSRPTGVFRRFERRWRLIIFGWHSSRACPSRPWTPRGDAAWSAEVEHEVEHPAWPCLPLSVSAR